MIAKESSHSNNEVSRKMSAAYLYVHNCHFSVNAHVVFNIVVVDLYAWELTLLSIWCFSRHSYCHKVADLAISGQLHLQL